MTVPVQMTKRVLSCILICILHMLLFSGCLFLTPAETTAAAETEPLTSEFPTYSEAESPTIPADVPSDASAYNGHYYKIYFEQLHWDEARLECIKLGGHLATITDAEEQQFIDGLNGSRKKLWIGGFLEDNQWRWVTEEAFEFTYWGKGEPNNSSNVISNAKVSSVNS